MIAVEAHDVAVRLGSSNILRGVTISIARGEAVALLGANGSGKSTLVRALVGVVPVCGGTISLLGQPLGRTVAWDQIGYVPQRVSAASGMSSTAAEIVASGLLNQRRLRLPRGWRSRVEEALDLVGLAHRAGDPTAHLSGGQQQRVLIARALIRRPTLLILDEPVAGVDAPSQEAFASTLAQLIGTGVTVVVVLHEIGPLAPLIRRTVVLRHGRVVHDGEALPPAPDHTGPGHVHLHPHDAAAHHSTGIEPWPGDPTQGARLP